MFTIRKFAMTLYRSIVGYPVGYRVVVDEGSNFAMLGTVVGKFYDPATHLLVYSVNVGPERKKRKDQILEGIQESRLTPLIVGGVKHELA
jgi:hypothetical protein